MNLVPIKRWSHHMAMLKKQSMVLWMNHMIEDGIFWAIAALLAIYIAILVILALN